MHLNPCCRLSVVAALAANLNSSHGTGVILKGQIHFMGHSSAGRADTAGSYKRETAICDGQLREGVI